MKEEANFVRAVFAPSRSGGLFSKCLFASSKRALPPILVFSLSLDILSNLVIGESLLREADTSSSPSSWSLVCLRALLKKTNPRIIIRASITQDSVFQFFSKNASRGLTEGSSVFISLLGSIC